METNLTNQKDYTREIQEALLERQKASAATDLSNSNPERWVTAATMLIEGSPIKAIRDATGSNHYTIKRVEAAMNEQLCDIARQKAFETRVLTNMNDELMAKQYNKLHEKMDKEEELTDEEARILKNIADAGVKLSHRVDRLEGRADQIVEHRDARSPEQLTQELEKMFGEVVDAELIEDE